MAQTKTTKAAAAKTTSASKAKTTAASDTTAAAKEIAALDTATKKAEVKKTEEKKPAAKKPAAKKAAPKKTTTTRAKKVEPMVVLQFGENDYNIADIQAKVEEAFKAENGRKTISEMNIYVKPEDFKAYYVVKSGKTEINGDVDL